MTDVRKIAEIEREHRVYADIGVIEDCTEHGIHETHRVALRFGPCKRVFVGVESIWGIVEQFDMRAAKDAFKPRNR